MRFRNRNLSFAVMTAWLLCAAMALVVTPSVSAAEEDDASCVKCENGNGEGGSCLVNRHEAFGTGTLHGPAHANVCKAGDCATNHPNNPSCFEIPSPAQLESITNAAASVRVADRSAVVQRFGKSIRYNGDRNAIQILGCEGAIVANIPLTSHKAAFASRVGH